MAANGHDDGVALLDRCGSVEAAVVDAEHVRACEKARGRNREKKTKRKCTKNGVTFEGACKSTAADIAHALLTGLSLRFAEAGDASSPEILGGEENVDEHNPHHYSHTGERAHAERSWEATAF